MSISMLAGKFEIHLIWSLMLFNPLNQVFFQKHPLLVNLARKQSLFWFNKGDYFIGVNIQGFNNLNEIED